MEGPSVLLEKLCHTRSRRLVLILGVLAYTILGFHTFNFPFQNASPPSFPTTQMAMLWKEKQPEDGSSSKSSRIGELSLKSDSGISASENLEETVGTETTDEIDGNNNQGKEKKYDEDNDAVLDEDGDPDNEYLIKLGDGVTLKKIKDPVGGFLTLVKVNESEDPTLLQKTEKAKEGQDVALTIDDVGLVDINIQRKEGPFSSADTNSSLISSYTKDSVQEADLNSSDSSVNAVINISSTDKLEGLVPPNRDKPNLSLRKTAYLSTNSSLADTIRMLRRKKKYEVLPKSMLEMNDLLVKARRSYRTPRPRWSSVHDQQLLAIRSKIEEPLIIKNDQNLHEPAFRNVSMFKRSYELMERTLKVYVYKEGKRPIFHQPLLKGIYASEGWFMKLMEGNRRFTVRDPKKANMFYMPFSSRFLEFTLYVPNSHNRTNLRGYLQSYVDMIAGRYPFWNRTFGTDHFLVACHDWAPYETRHTMERSIRALCNADLSEAFTMGKDVSLPETYVRSGRNPLRDLGGKPAKERSIFAFYAGNMHGYLRTILLQYWENKDPDLKIYGPMPPGVKSKMNYIQHMKSSKYCICPRGYEVNSPRVVEAIFYECVPVIISDNYVPPFFEVLNWEAFAVFIAEVDIPRLKEILLSIPEEKYQSLQMGVKKVQKHFLWHAKPVKYDLFHMTLHSIWYNRVYTIKPR